MRDLSQKALILLGFVLTACGGSTTTEEISQPPIRTGGQLESIPVKYHDLSPVLSADGTKVAFVSGRDTTDKGAALHVYKAEWAAGEKPGKLTRATTQSLGLEKVVAISPDGATLAIVVSKENADNVYAVPFAGGDAVQVTSDGGEKTRLQFADDGALLAWIHSAAGVAKAFVGDTAGNAAQALNLEGVTDLTWIPTGAPGNYRLAVRAADGVTGKVMVRSFAFDSVDSAASAEPTDLGEAFVGTKHEMTASADLLVASERVIPAGSQRIERLGDFEDKKPEDKFKSNVEDRPLLLATSDGAATTWDASAGDSAKSFSLVSDGLHFLSRNSFRCAKDKTIGFTWAISAAATDGSEVIRRFPRYNKKTKAWEVSEDICERKNADKSAGQFDEMIAEMKVATAGSLAAFRGVYVSRFSVFKDKECRPKAGDPEIRLIDVADEVTIYELSSNPYPELKDSDRGSKGKCP